MFAEENDKDMDMDLERTKEALVSLLALKWLNQNLTQSALQEDAAARAQEALRMEAHIRAKLRDLVEMKEAMRRRTKKVAKVPRAKQQDPAQKRVVKRLENCPGVNGPSASGKRIRKLPSYWAEQKADDNQLVAKDVTGQEAVTAGLLGGLDATFSFSPLERGNFFAGKSKIEEISC